MENTKGDTEKEVQVSPWRVVISLFVRVLFTNHKQVMMLPIFYSSKGRQIHLDYTIMIRICLRIIWNWGGGRGFIHK